jgi:hydroxymethylpyrimidine pyrophosphatase-like HAD family hydrolase
MRSLCASRALACDYDGTLAYAGVVSAATVRALKRFRDSGRKLLLVTGRIMADLERIFPKLDLFDCAVAENGPVLLDPRTRERTILARWPSERFAGELRKSGVPDVSVGDVVVATMRVYEPETLAAIRSMSLDLRIIHNKDSLMVLPAGMDKMTGLAAALGRLKISPKRVIAVGDGENDEPFLAGCGCAVAVANAVPELKAKADLVTAGERGEGVIELIELVLGSAPER